MELTAALLAAQREGDVRRRILVVNPEPDGKHIEPIALRDAQYAAAPSDDAGYAALAERVVGHVQPLHGLLGGILPVAPPSQYPSKLAGAARFVGRLPELWRIHSALQAGESAIISGTTASGLAVVSGLGGIGKSLLTEEMRFGSALPIRAAFSGCGPLATIRRTRRTRPHLRRGGSNSSAPWPWRSASRSRGLSPVRLTPNCVPGCQQIASRSSGSSMTWPPGLRPMP